MPKTDQSSPEVPAQTRRGPRTAVLVIDMLNDYRHPDGEPLMASAREAVPVLERVLTRAEDTGTLVVYVNDNHGQWSVTREQLIEASARDGDPALIEPIAPGGEVPFVLKARHSVFYGSMLEYLLDAEGVGRLVLTGQVTEQCVLYSALDAYIRHFEVVVLRDAVAHIDPELADAALKMMERNMRAEVVGADEVDLEAEAHAHTTKAEAAPARS